MATYTLTMRFHVNGGTITDSPHQSGSNYFKVTSNYVYKATSASGTYSYCTNTRTATSGSSGNSKTVYANLWNVETFNLTRAGYHIDGTKAYRVGSASSTKYANQDTTAASDTNAATAFRLNGDAYVSKNKTVVLYANWLGNSYIVRFNASGGSGTMSDQTGFVFGTSKALSSNTFTRTGYTFAGWSKSSGSNINVWGARDEAADYANAIGTDGTYLYLKQNGGPTYFRITVDGSDTYTNLGSTAPSGVSSWVQATSSSNTITFQNSQYYYNNGWNENHDWCDVYRVDGAQTVDYTNGASMSDAGGQTPVEAGTTVVNLYAVWTPNTYSLLFNDNQADGSGTGLTEKTVTYNSNDNRITPVTKPTRHGYYFEGYYDAQTGGNQVYDSSVIGVSGTYWSSNNTWQYTGNVNLYAHWSPLSSMYKLNPNGGIYGGTTGTTSKTVTFGTTNNNTPGVPTRTGFQFTGWYTEAEGGRQVFDSNGNPVEDYLNGPWVSCSPTTSLGTNARYLHYGEVVWGWYYNSSSDNKLAFWAEGQWNVKSTNSSYGNSYLYGAGNLIGSLQPQIQVGGLVALTAAHCDTEQSQIITNTSVFGTDFSFNNNIVASSTTLPTDGYVWIATYSSTPTYYAHWTETTPPSNLSITSTNNVAASQTVTLSATDNVGVTGYYWGTSSSTSVTYTEVTSTTSWSTTRTIISGGKYYLRVKDASGNTNYTSAVFRETHFSMRNGTVSPAYVITKAGNSFTLPTPTAASGYTNEGHWINTHIGFYSYGDTFTPTSYTTYLESSAAISPAGKLPATGISITDTANDFTRTTNSQGLATFSINSLKASWDELMEDPDYEDWPQIKIGGVSTGITSPSMCLETIMYNEGNSGYYNTNDGNYGIQVTVVGSDYQFYVYDLNSIVPKIYVKNGGTWKSAIAYVKISGEWKLMPTAYIKQNGSWTQT